MRAWLQRAVAIICAAIFACGHLLANGGPFVIKYPGGDTSAKGVLARLDSDLRPGFEERLRVVSEHLKIEFGNAEFVDEPESTPLVHVTASYKIENPTADAITVDFGFPVVRGFYIHPLMMIPRPDVRVTVNGTGMPFNLISNSTIYGIIRGRAHDTIESSILKDAALSRLVTAARSSKGSAADRRALAAHLTGQLKWSPRDAALMVEYATLDLGAGGPAPFDSGPLFAASFLPELEYAWLGPLGAIGEQKATQLLAHLASRFDPAAASTYERIFAAWGGDVREHSVDISTGAVVPREITLDGDERSEIGGHDWNIPRRDPSVYARVDYLDPNAKISSAEKDSCRAILRNLPVVFTFAPMNLIHYQVKFPPKSLQTVEVSYRQFAYEDSRRPATYQFAYLVHPASLWKEFGPIELEVSVPTGVPIRASVPTSRRAGPDGSDIHTATLTGKTGEIYVAIGAREWDSAPRGKSAHDIPPL